MSFARRSGVAVDKFIRGNIIYGFDIPKRVLYGDCTTFINYYVRQLCKEYGVNHVKLNSYYSQRIGQVVATNKT